MTRRAGPRRRGNKTGTAAVEYGKPSRGEPEPLRDQRLARFDQAVLPHRDAAYNLARWLTGNDHDADDVVQEAYLRAVKFFDSFRGGDARPWLLAIVRRVCYDWLKRTRSQPLAVFDEELPSDPKASVDPAQPP